VFKAFFKGVAHGFGILFGMIVLVVLMQVSASILSKYGLIDGLEKKQERLEQEYCNEQ
jgi:hypothetical protein